MNCHVVISNVFYDGTGNLLTETDALGNRVTYAYTPEGWLESVTRADGTVLAFAYDRTGSLLIQNVGDGQTVESSYNDVGMVTEVSGAEESITYQYDERGYLLSVENVNGDVVSYTYDEYGNRTSMTYPDGRVVSYTYDRMNRLTGVTGLDGEVTTYTYDAAGRRTETSGSTLTTSYRYDSVGNLVEQVTHGESEIAFSYAYDAYDRNGTTCRRCYPGRHTVNGRTAMPTTRWTSWRNACATTAAFRHLHITLRAYGRAQTRQAM